MGGCFTARGDVGTTVGVLLMQVGYSPPCAARTNVECKSLSRCAGQELTRVLGLSPCFLMQILTEVKLGDFNRGQYLGMAETIAFRWRS